MAGTTVIGNGSPTSTINYTSDAGNLIDFTKFFAGKTANTSGTSGEAVQGQTGPLEALLSTVSDPNNLLNIVQSLFNQGAQQVPALTAQYANATGTRTGNNGMLSSSLAQLSQTLAQAIATQIIQQQQTAVNAASTLASTNKTKSTTNAQKTAEQGNVGRASGIGSAVLGGGVLLNKYGDKIMDKANSVLSPNGAPVAIGPQVYPDFPTVDMPGPIYAGGGTGAIDPTALLSAAGFDMPTGMPAPVDTSATDLETTGIDSASAVPESFDVASADFSDVGDFSDYLGFADGGTVLPPQAQPMVRNRAFTPPSVVMPTMAAAPVQQQQMPAPTGSKKQKGPMDTAGDSTETGGVDANASGGPSGSMSFSPGAAALAGLAGFALSGGNIGMGLFSAAKSAMTQDLVSNLVATLTTATPTTSAAPDTEGLEGTGFSASAGNFGMALSAPDANATALEGSQTASMDFGGNFGMADASGFSDTSSSSTEGGTDAGGTDAGGGADAGGGGGGGDGFADGGEIALPKQRRAGTDTMTIRATPGEVIIPVDVADYIGRDTLNALIEMVHVPVRSGTRG